MWSSVTYVMAARQREHAVVNVYGEETVEIVENAIDAAKNHHGADTKAEAVEMICAAYTGYGFGD